MSYRFGSLLGDDIKFKQVDEMKQIRANLMRFDPISEIARQAFSQLATELLAQDISEGLRTPDGGLYELRGSTRSVRFSATSCALKEESRIELLNPVVEEFDSRSGRSLRTMHCRTATIYVDQNIRGPGLGMSLRDARIEETDRRMLSYSVQGLALPAPLLQRLCPEGMGVLDVVLPDGRASALPESPSSMLAARVASLTRQIRRTLVDIKAETNSRLVFGIGCIPMIMIGIGLGIVNRGGHLLSAFGASCIPSAVLIVAIISGKHVTENMTAQGVSGIAVMWAGLACLSVLATLIYARLARN